MRTASVLVLLAATSLTPSIGCGEPRAPNPYESIAPPPATAPVQRAPEPAHEAPVAVAPVQPPPGDVCAKIPATRGTVPFRDPNATKPVAGQMTEQAAQAKRLFDSERWRDAELALARVAAGETGDDEGNKQLADYHRAIVLFRMKRLDEAAARFRAFSRNPGHLKFVESLLWIVKIAREAPRLVRLEDVALYTPEEIARFDNENQRDTFGAASYLVAHERYDEGNLSEAERLFQNAKRAGPWPREAERCLARLAEATPGGRRGPTR